MLMKKTWMLLLGIVLVSLALAGAFVEKKAKLGSNVTLNCTLMLPDGTVYYTTAESGPFQATLGDGTLISGFEEAVLGMQVGDSKTITVPPEKAYGLYRSDLVGVISRDQLPEGLQPELGKRVQTELLDGTQATAVITEITEATVTLDANNPLAGQTLIFDIELVAIGGSSISTGANQMIPGWMIVISSVATAGFVFFNSRKGRRLTPVRSSSSLRRPHR